VCPLSESYLYGGHDKESSSETNLSTNYLYEGWYDRGQSLKLQVVRIWRQILFKNEEMIEDYPKIPYKNFILLKRGFSLFLEKASDSYQRLTSLWQIILELSILLIVVSLLSVLIKDLYVCGESSLDLSIC